MNKQQTQILNPIDYVKENIKFVYDEVLFRKTSSSREDVSMLTLAYKIEDNKLKFNFALKSESDRFVKAIGRQIASRRLLDTPIELPFVYPSSDDDKKELSKVSLVLDTFYDWLFNLDKTKHSALKNILYIEPF